MATYIDMTPTWAAVLPMYLACIEQGSAEGVKAAKEELTRMAKLADKYNELAKENKE